MHAAIPSRTAFRVALRRAAHQIVDAAPLVFDDPLAVRIVGRDAAAELLRTPSAERKPYSAALRAWMVARSRFAEDNLRDGVRGRNGAAGVTQYLLLGAGLDTFGYRNPFPGVRVFEVDHPATQAWKAKLLEENGIPTPDSTLRVPVDFERDDLREELTRAGFDAAAVTATAWLGVVPYLTREAFRSTLRLLGSFAPGSSVTLDYSLPREMLPEREQQMLDSLAERVAQAGEPFRLFLRPDEMGEELLAAGLVRTDDLDNKTVSRRYFAGRTDGLELRGSGARLCRAVVPLDGRET